jgi:hypothetical protein
MGDVPRSFPLAIAVASVKQSPCRAPRGPDRQRVRFKSVMNRDRSTPLWLIVNRKDGAIEAGKAEELP